MRERYTEAATTQERREGVALKEEEREGGEVFNPRLAFLSFFLLNPTSFGVPDGRNDCVCARVQLVLIVYMRPRCFVAWFGRGK